MESYIAERHIVTSNGIVKPGGVVMIAEESADEFKSAGWISDMPKKETEPDGQDGQDEIMDIGNMTHEQLDAIANQLEIPVDEYPKKGNKEEKVASIEKFTETE